MEGWELDLVSRLSHVMSVRTGSSQLAECGRGLTVRLIKQRGLFTLWGTVQKSIIIIVWRWLQLPLCSSQMAVLYQFWHITGWLLCVRWRRGLAYWRLAKRYRQALLWYSWYPQQSLVTSAQRLWDGVVLYVQYVCFILSKRISNMMVVTFSYFVQFVLSEVFFFFLLCSLHFNEVSTWIYLDRLDFLTIRQRLHVV